MFKIAEEKHHYYNILRGELVTKYKTRKAQEAIYKEKCEDKWTFYISLKR